MSSSLIPAAPSVGAVPKTTGKKKWTDSKRPTAAKVLGNSTNKRPLAEPAAKVVLTQPAKSESDIDEMRNTGEFTLEDFMLPGPETDTETCLHSSTEIEQAKRTMSTPKKEIGRADPLGEYFPFSSFVLGVHTCGVSLHCPLLATLPVKRDAAVVYRRVAAD